MSLLESYLVGFFIRRVQAVAAKIIVLESYLIGWML